MTPSDEAPQERTLLESVRGVEVVHWLEEEFYNRVLRDPVLREVFGERRPDHVDHLTAFTAESFGGDDRFTRELGFAHLIDVHRGLRITEEQRTRFVRLYLDAMDAVGLTSDPRVRAAVVSHVQFGSRVATQTRGRPRTRNCIHCARSRVGPSTPTLNKTHPPLDEHVPVTDPRMGIG